LQRSLQIPEFPRLLEPSFQRFQSLRMLFNQADNNNPDSMASRLRRRRTEWLNSLVEGFPEPVRILDVGGTVGFWKNNVSALNRRCRLTLVNLDATDVSALPDTTSLVGDARNLVDVADQSFDVCFSNSVIEHVGTLYDQIRMAREVKRVAKSWFIQTPNRYFPIEPHFLVPGWQFAPIWLRTFLLMRRRIGWMDRTPDKLQARAFVEHVRLLSFWEMQALFPESEIRRETLGPLTKSFVAIRTGAAGSQKGENQ
jgi:hypothetical protein